MAHRPTEGKFNYDRSYPPLFLAKPTSEEQETWSKSMDDVAREYFRMSRLYNISAQTMLSNGITAGEYGMYTLLENHQKRNR